MRQRRILRFSHLLPIDLVILLPLTVLQQESADIEDLSSALQEAVPHVKHLPKAIAYLILFIWHRRPAEEHEDLIRLVDQQAPNMEVEKMAKSIADVLIESGFVEHFAESIAESVAESTEPNIEHCINQGIEHGKMLAKQEYIIQLLYSRFLAIPDPVRNKIQLIHDIAHLDTIFNKALTVETIDEIGLQNSDD